MPAGFWLADPGVRDALLHGMQVAVPDERLVPVAARGANAELASRLVQATHESFDHAVTRLWTAMEWAAKLGCPDPQLLVVSTSGEAVCVRAGDIEVTTLLCEVLGTGWVAIGVATQPRPVAAALAPHLDARSLQHANVDPPQDASRTDAVTIAVEVEKAAGATLARA